ncbi:MAG TPA: flagellar hook-basal body protein [Opitutaceae bacterium]|nr:flagellar hook-basal body protein [Opitutaceae bacterium]
MNIGLYLGAAAMGALERWQEATSQNIAASGTPGYRKREVEFSMDAAGALPAGAANGNATQPAEFPSSRVSVAFHPGQLIGTGRELDVAIQGDGLFEVQTADGNRAYTRAGSFYTNSERVLVDAQGNTLLGEGGAPIQLLPDGGPLAIAGDGTLSQNGQQIGRLTIQRFADPQQLTPLSGGLFAAGGQTPETVENPTLVQGSLETSNVQAVGEMVNLIQISRAYEAAQKVITSRDDTLDKTIRAAV